MAAAHSGAAMASLCCITALKSFELPQHVHACRTSNGIIFLDTRKDRYFGLSGKQADAIASMVRDWPERSAAYFGDTSMSPEDPQPLAQALFEQGLLVRSSSISVARPITAIPPLEMTPPGLPTDNCRGARLLDIANFVVACTRAAWALKLKSLEWIELEMRSVRAEHPEGQPHHGDTAAQLAQVFRRLRRFFFSEKNRCLFNALSLMYFLRPYGHFPLWVIGVNPAPFAAHSWVQDGPTALDGDPAVICHFVPILVA